MSFPIQLHQQPCGPALTDGEGPTPCAPYPRPSQGTWALAAQSAAKQAVDFVGAVIGLVVLAPLMLVLAFLIRLDSPGPVLFRQRRLGRGGRPFWLLKFRTMLADAERRVDELEPLNESAEGVLFKIRDDPRITRLGRLLRRTSLDELPQLINVLRGEMSLVGPRPLQLRDSQKLAGVDPQGFALRLTMLPGLTGAWQVGRRNGADFESLLRLDREYVERWSLGQDLRILCRTLPVVLAGSSRAY